MLAVRSDPIERIFSTTLHCDGKRQIAFCGFIVVMSGTAVLPARRKEAEIEYIFVFLLVMQIYWLLEVFILSNFRRTTIKFYQNQGQLLVKYASLLSFLRLSPLNILYFHSEFR